MVGEYRAIHIVILAKVNDSNGTVRSSLAQSALCLQLAGAIVGDGVCEGVNALVVVDVLIALNLLDGVDVGTRLLKGDALELSVTSKNSTGTCGVSRGALRHWGRRIKTPKLKDKDVRSVSFVFGAILQEVIDEAINEAIAETVIASTRWVCNVSSTTIEKRGQKRSRRWRARMNLYWNIAGNFLLNGWMNHDWQHAILVSERLSFNVLLGSEDMSSLCVIVVRRVLSNGVGDSICCCVVNVLTKAPVDNGVGIISVISNVRSNCAGIKVLIVGKL